MRAALRSPYLALALAMLLWSGNALLGRAIRADVSPVTLNLLRWGVALAVLLPLSARTLLRERARWLQKLPLLALLALLGVTAFNWLLYLALASTTATNAALIYANVPVLTVPIAWWLAGERVTGRQLVGIAVSMAGVVAIITRGDPGLLLGLGVNRGDLWALATVPVWSLYTVLLRRRSDGLSALPFLCVLGLLGIVPLLPAALWEQAAGGHLNLTPATLSALLYVGVVASIGAFALWNVAAGKVGPTRAGLFTHLYPVFTAALAAVFLGERLSGYHLAGAALVGAGLYLTTRAGRARPTPAPAAEPSL